MTYNPHIPMAQKFWQQDYWSGFQSPVDSVLDFIVLLG